MASPSNVRHPAMTNIIRVEALLAVLRSARPEPPADDPAERPVVAAEESVP